MRMTKVQPLATLFLAMLPASLVANDLGLVMKIRDSAFHQLTSVETVQCRATLNRPRGGQSKISYFRNGNRYRVERNDLEPSTVAGEPVSTPYHVWTYDGELYRMFNEENKTLKLTDGRGAAGSADPISVPFDWVAHLNCESPFRENLVSSKIWEVIFENARVRGQARCRGKECVVLEFKQACTNPVASFRVYFLIEERYFPVRCERWLENGQDYDSFSEVVDYKRHVIGDQQFVIPLLHRYEQGTDYAMETKIDLESVVLNEPVEDEMFTIDPSLAKSVYTVRAKR